MSGVKAGKLRHRVELQELQTTQNPVTGEITETFVTIAQPWAEIHPMSGREFYAASAEQSEVRGRITIRYRGGVDHTMRIRHRGMIYNILAVMPDNESGIDHLTLMTGEGVRQ